MNDKRKTIIDFMSLDFKFTMCAKYFLLLLLVESCCFKKKISRNFLKIKSNYILRYLKKKKVVVSMFEKISNIQQKHNQKT